MNPLQIHNTLSGHKETFVPLREGKVKMYVCGVTPYDQCHLGHARCYVFFDTARRFLKKRGYEVEYIQNFTDIDDKIIARAKALNQPAETVANRFIEDYFNKMDLLNVQRADFYPRVTGFMPQIIEFIQKLVQQGAAYPVDGDIYYSVRKGKDYGKLSKRKLNEMESGARVEVDPRKQDPMDFALWKKAKNDEPSWDSPWSKGRPGWHIECSVMSIKHLGETFDVHGGGQDLIFPHHENEIAQSESATGKPFARYWVHNGFVTVNREKMSKSLGNFFTLEEIFKKVPPEIVRFYLLSCHYRSPLDFADQLLDQSMNAYRGLQDANEMCSFLLGDDEVGPEPLLKEWENIFIESLNDDLNTEKAMAVVFQLKNEMVEKMDPAHLDWLRKARNTLSCLLNDFLGVVLKSNLTSAKIKTLKIKLAQREQHRKKKEWELADRIRKEIEAEGFLIEDSRAAGALVKSKHP